MCLYFLHVTRDLNNLSINIFIKMYTSEFRDNLYQQQNDNPPRITSEHVESAVNWFNQHLPGNMEWKHVLDYGCGNGGIWWNLLQKWADVDFVEISNKMVEFLRKKYVYPWKLSKLLDGKDVMWESKVFWAESPQDLPVKRESYDYIITWSVFHHIDPNNWKNFLDKFSELLKIGWRMVITWRDESDVVLQQDWFKWRVTWQPSYSINSLLECVDRERYEVEETWVYNEKLAAFNIPRMFRYYVLSRK